MSKSLRIALVVVGIASALGCTPQGKPTPSPTPTMTPPDIHKLDEGDRPPIIISDGSLNAMIDTWAYDRGTWEKPGTDDKYWYHKFTDLVYPNKMVKKFTFYLLNGDVTQGQNGCEEITNGVETQWLEVKAGSQNLRLWINPDGNAQIDFDNPTPRHPYVLFWLHYEDSRNPPKMTKVTFQKMFGQDTPPAICNFRMNGPSLIRVKQSY